MSGSISPFWSHSHRRANSTHCHWYPVKNLPSWLRTPAKASQQELHASGVDLHPGLVHLLLAISQQVRRHFSHQVFRRTAQPLHDRWGLLLLLQLGPRGPHVQVLEPDPKGVPFQL